MYVCKYLVYLDGEQVWPWRVDAVRARSGPGMRTNVLVGKLVGILAGKRAF